MYYVFVYGTLKRNQPNHNVLNDRSRGTARFIGTARTVEKFPLVIATKHHLPHLLNVPGVGHHVVGEVYEFDDQMLFSCDEFEAVPRYFNRTTIQVEMIPELAEARKVSGAQVQPEVRHKQTCTVYILEDFQQWLMRLKFYEEYVNRPEDPDLKFIRVKDRDVKKSSIMNEVKNI